MGPDGQDFRLGAQLDRPENFWGLESCPDDMAGSSKCPRPPLNTPPKNCRPSPLFCTSRQNSFPASRDVLDKLEEQLSEDRLRGILAKLVRPMQAEVTELREKLAVNASATASRCPLDIFRLSMEEKLWERPAARPWDARPAADARTVRRDSRIGENGYRAKDQCSLTEFRHRLAGETARRRTNGRRYWQRNSPPRRNSRSAPESRNCSGRLWSREHILTYKAKNSVFFAGATYKLTRGSPPRDRADPGRCRCESVSASVRSVGPWPDDISAERVRAPA